MKSFKIIDDLIIAKTKQEDTIMALFKVIHDLRVENALLRQTKIDFRDN